MHHEPPSDDHLLRLADALRDEAALAAREHRERLGRPLDERVATGVSAGLLDLVDGRPGGWGRTVATYRMPRGASPHDGIGAGDPVELWFAQQSERGLCIGADDGDYDVLLDGEPPERAELVLRFDPTTYERYQQGLARAAELDPDLRAALLDPPPPEPADAPFPRLHEAQARAARLALGDGPVVAIQGPPGTGKTHTIVEVLRAAVDRGERCLAAADSNAAVDHLARRAADSGLRVVRLGHPARAGDAVYELTLDQRVASGVLGPALEAIGRDYARLPDDRAHREQRKELRRERARLLRQARETELDKAEVIAGTLGTLAKAVLPPIDRAVLDEATQALEPAVWACAHHAARWVLVGDPEQLGPVVLRTGSPLETSLLQRLVAQGLALPMLARQHRMHAAIQALVADRYGPELHPAPDVAEHTLDPSSDDPLLTRPTAWIDTSGSGWAEERDPVTRSLHNEGERRAVVAVVRRLQAGGVAPERIGVIAPYSAQVVRLRPELPGIQVATVNAFQGREKDAIVCTWVRSNERGDLGFVADGRRLTVALSRARQLLVQVGDSATLASSPRFASVLDELAAQDALDSVWSEPWSELMG